MAKTKKKKTQKNLQDNTQKDSQEGNHALWGGRFQDSPSEFAQAFGASLLVDKAMWESDIAGSKAHAKMLAKQGIISEKDKDAIIAGLDEIAKEIKEGAFVFDVADEDIHMAIERKLIEKIGEAGGRLHTARSRNDQVATDTRMHAKKLCLQLMKDTMNLTEVLLNLAEEHFGVIMPGYTHMQKAQPILFSHHMLAYFWMFMRDYDRLFCALMQSDVLVLGSAALAGSTYDIDRYFVCDELSFDDVCQNSLDGVSDRDFLLDLDYACSVSMMHLSRLSEELILWSTDEFSFITLSDGYSTGSSIMPQKKNPDFAELIRGKTGRVYGDLIQLLTTMKSLPLAYNKDMQEDKEGAFDAAKTLGSCLLIMAGMLSSMTVNKDTMLKGAKGGFMAATDLADYLVGKGMAFRDAHAVVGKLVLSCEKSGKTLQDLTVQDLKEADELFDEKALDAVDIEKVVSRRNVDCGTGHEAVKNQLELAKERQEGYMDQLEHLISISQNISIN